jgi:hypothetical protein
MFNNLITKRIEAALAKNQENKYAEAKSKRSYQTSNPTKTVSSTFLSQSRNSVTKGEQFCFPV